VTIQRVHTSLSRLEWWNTHLTGALARRVPVYAHPMATSYQTGDPAETDVRRLIDGPVERAAYLGSVEQLFGGIVELPMPTAIWTDFLLPINARILPCLRLFDVVFGTQKDAIPELCRAGLDARWLPFAFDTALKNDPDAEKIYDVGFVGNLDLPATRAERLDLLSRLERQYRMNDYRTSVYGDEMMHTYNRSRIVVNIPVTDGFNMRTFEAMASGALLLTKAVGNGQTDLFGDGVHFVTYRDGDDLLDKVAYFLGHDRERQEIAAAGRREVLARHTYDHRAAEVLDALGRASRTRTTAPADIVDAYAMFYDRHIRRPDLLVRLAFLRGVPLKRRAHIVARAAWKFLRTHATIRAASNSQSREIRG
jgi:glycosyl transferase family 1